MRACRAARGRDGRERRRRFSAGASGTAGAVPGFRAGAARRRDSASDDGERGRERISGGVTGSAGFEAEVPWRKKGRRRARQVSAGASGSARDGRRWCRRTTIGNRWRGRARSGAGWAAGGGGFERLGGKTRATCMRVNNNAAPTATTASRPAGCRRRLLRDRAIAGHVQVKPTGNGCWSNADCFAARADLRRRLCVSVRRRCASPPTRWAPASSCWRRRSARRTDRAAALHLIGRADAEQIEAEKTACGP